MLRILAALVPVLLGAVALSPAGHATAAQAQSSRTGCAADSDLVNRQLVEKAKVVTESGRVFAVIRFFAGKKYDERSASYEPRYCIDLVVADAFRGRHPKFQAEVSSVRYGGGANGRAHTGRFDGGQPVANAGEKIQVTFTTYGLEAYGSMKLTFPQLD